MSITVIGLDAGVSNTTSICVLRGNKWDVTCLEIKAVRSISGPQVEQFLTEYNTHYNPKIVIMELNGPGATLSPYFQQNQPQIPLATIDVALPLPEDCALVLWDELQVDNKTVLNVRAAMYWILRLMFRDQKIKLLFDDEELEVQLGTLQWDTDTQRGDKIFMTSKKKLRFKSSELDSEPFSKSPDKADSLALAILGYTILMQQQLGDDDEIRQDVDEGEIFDPTHAGFFQLDHLTQEAVE